MQKFLIAITPCLGIITLGTLEAISMIKGIGDGSIFMAIAAIIGGLAGYQAKIIKDASLINPASKTTPAPTEPVAK